MTGRPFTWPWHGSHCFFQSQSRFGVYVTGAAYRTMSHLGMSHLLWGIALQMTLSMFAALVVALRLRQRPRLWELRFTLAGICLLVCGEVVACLLFMIGGNGE